MIELSSVSLLSINIIYIIIFIAYILLIILTMLYVSSYLAASIMLFIPVLILLVKPDFGIEFLSHKQGEFLGGILIINNIHILLLIWSALLSIIIYTELLSWYISRGTFKHKTKKPGSIEPETKRPEPTEPKTKKESSNAESNESPAEPAKKTIKQPGQINIPFKPLERFLVKLESLLGGKK
jgi:hypothetical protein